MPKYGIAEHKSRLKPNIFLSYYKNLLRDYFTIRFCCCCYYCILMLAFFPVSIIFIHGIYLVDMLVRCFCWVSHCLLGFVHELCSFPCCICLSILSRHALLLHKVFESFFLLLLFFHSFLDPKYLIHFAHSLHRKTRDITVA